jgi:DNA-binding MarR family transcriptional regulator
MAQELGQAHKEAWVTLYVSSSLLKRRIDRFLTEKGLVSLEVYDVLLTLESAQHGRMRMSDLADQVFFSRSGITRVVDRLEADGLLQRIACPSDRRAIWAAITPKGIAERQRSWSTYSEAIQEFFAKQMTEDQAQQLSGILRQILQDFPDVNLHGVSAEPRSTASYPIT